MLSALLLEDLFHSIRPSGDTDALDPYFEGLADSPAAIMLQSRVTFNAFGNLNKHTR
jgi:hypothetical protein